MNLKPWDLTPDFSSDDFQENLYTHYRNYLDHTPVFRNDEGVVYVTRYQDCSALLSGKQFMRAPPGVAGAVFVQNAQEQTVFEKMISHWMVFMDPPRHDVVRKAFLQFFSARVLKQLDPFIRNQSRRLVDQMPDSQMPDSGEVEMLESFAFTLPVLVIAEIIGVPESDAEMFRDWSMQLTMALDRGNEEDMRQGVTVGHALTDYISELKRRADLPQHSLLRALIGDAGAKLTAEEIVYGCVFLLWAGHETTKNLISNGIHILSTRPAVLAHLQRHPERIELAIEEMLRFETPVQKLSRWAHEDACFGEYRVPKGTMVTALLGAANRDHSVFENPDEFNAERGKNRHLAFGTGIHHCLGAMLARVEARIAFGELLPRLHELQPSQHKWRTFSSFRSLDALSVRARIVC